MKWIREHKLIATVVAIMLALLIIFVVSLVKDSHVSAAGSAVKGGIGRITGALYSFTENVKEGVGGIFNKEDLRDEIEALKKENEELKIQLTESRLEQEELDELRELSDAMNFGYSRKKYELTAADVISCDGSNWTNEFTVNKGTEAGISEGDAVLNGMGLIGHVSEAGKNYSKITAIIDEDSSISFRLSRDRRQLGIADGTEDGSLKGFMMDADSNVQEGDVILTSGLGVFPKGLEIGTVKSVTYNSNTLLREIEIEPSASFKALDKVAVLTVRSEKSEK